MSTVLAERARPARQRWYDGLPAVTAHVDCGGQSHRITWRAGRLVLEDHDLLAERALAALGSDPPRCVEILDAWRRSGGRVELCGLLFGDALTPGGAAAAARLLDSKADIERIVRARAVLPRFSPALRKSFEERFGDKALASARVMRDMALVDLVPEPVRGRLRLAFIVAIARRWQDGGFRLQHGMALEDALAAITNPLVERSVRHWRRNTRPHATIGIETLLLAPGAAATCSAWLRPGGGLVWLALPLSWFTDVWARGIAFVDNCFVLACTGAGDAALTVRALRWERRSALVSSAVAAPAVVTGAAGGARSLRWLSPRGRAAPRSPRSSSRVGSTLSRIAVSRRADVAGGGPGT